MIFEHTHREPRMWRGWLRNGQSLEISWSKFGGWRTGIGIGIHSNDDDRGSRHLYIGIGMLQVYIPLGIAEGPYQVGEEPGWAISANRENIWVQWGRRSKFLNWPFHRITLAWDYETEDGGWQDVRTADRQIDGVYVRRPRAKFETHPYRYVLKSGTVQEVNATIFRERWTRGRHILSRIGWPKRVEYTIDIEFDDEVGERAGSWKGGTIGCSETMRNGETPLDTLRRMERERKFR